MSVSRCARLRSLALVLLVAACGERPIDWNAPENFLLHESSTRTDEGVVLEYVSLVDAPADRVYAALADVEHYPQFVPGVDLVNLLSVEDGRKTVQIAQRVIGRQTNAKVQWTFFPDRRRIEFHTLQSNLSNNDGSWQIDPSPDGKRSLVHTRYVVHGGEGVGAAIPMGVLVSGTREAFLVGAKAVRERAAGAPAQ
jgi:ribosome-associated toxin RatA of RatAB toxin-antitoxin module